MRTRRNPPSETTAIMIAPLVPYIAAAAVLYFFGGKIWEMVGAKVTGTSVTEFKQSSKIVSDAIFAPVTYVGDRLATPSNYISPAEQAAAIDKLNAEIAEKAKVKLVYVLPYPTPKSQEEFRANIAAMDAAMLKAGIQPKSKPVSIGK